MIRMIPRYRGSGLKLSSLIRTREYPRQVQRRGALLQRATASRVVLFTELVPSPLACLSLSLSLSLARSLGDSFHHYQTRHDLTTTRTIATTIVSALDVERRDAHSNIIEITVVPKDGTRGRNGAETERGRKREGALSEDSTESVESSWNFGRARARDQQRLGISVFGIIAHPATPPSPTPPRDNAHYHFLRLGRVSFLSSLGSWKSRRRRRRRSGDDRDEWKREQRQGGGGRTERARS